MPPVLHAVISFLRSLFRSRYSMQLEILSLRHQLSVLHLSVKRPKLTSADRIFWSWFSKICSRWQETLTIVQPRTVIAWRRKKFKEHWRKLSQRGRRPGRPKIAKEVRELIRNMSQANTFWGSPRIIGELEKIGIIVAKSTVEKYMIKRRKPFSPTWKAFLKTHIEYLVSIDFFVVPTVKFRVLFVLVVLAHGRRKILHFNVTEHPTAEWSSQQIIEAFPWEEAPKYLIRDRDGVYGNYFRKCMLKRLCFVHRKDSRDNLF